MHVGKGRERRLPSEYLLFPLMHNAFGKYYICARIFFQNSQSKIECEMKPNVFSLALAHVHISHSVRCYKLIIYSFSNFFRVTAVVRLLSIMKFAVSFLGSCPALWACPTYTLTSTNTAISSENLNRCVDNYNITQLGVFKSRSFTYFLDCSGIIYYFTRAHACVI